MLHIKYDNEFRFGRDIAIRLTLHSSAWLMLFWTIWLFFLVNPLQMRSVAFLLLRIGLVTSEVPEIASGSFHRKLILKLSLSLCSSTCR
jgi:hypothetical protein